MKGIDVPIFVNDRWVRPSTPYGRPALDFIRLELGLTGTKEGCREGDCGACAVIVGERIPGGAYAGAAFESGGGAFPGGAHAGTQDSAAAIPQGAARYRAVPSCLLALGELRGKHLITIEGLRLASPDGLTPVMKAFLEENASQCGFCTPGFIMALTSWLAEPGKPDLAGAMRAIDGNLCRCTGYGSIRRAAGRLVREFSDLPGAEGERTRELVRRGVLPASVLEFMEGGPEACGAAGEPSAAEARSGLPVIGGGTDYYVRNPEPEEDFSPSLLALCGNTSSIRTYSDASGKGVEIGAAVRARDFFASREIRAAAPGIEDFEGSFASTLIRNLATVGGNIANASPVGDLTSMLLACGARLVIGPLDLDEKGNLPTQGPSDRLVALEDFFLGYKKIDLKPGEVLKAIRLPARPEERAEPALLFSFEKISKRKILDIAAVNTAMSFRIEDGRFRGVRISAGGVAPTPVLLRRAAAVLEGTACPRGDARALASLARGTAAAAREEITPISDVRGSASYRRQILGRLVLAHFIRFFGEDGIAEELFP